MEANRKGIVLDKFEQNSEYDIIDSKSSVAEESGEASIIFSVTIRRKPRYIFLSIIFPIILLTILNIFVFVLPCDSGEKASYAITVFLSFAVFMTIVSASLPENSDSTAIFSVYILFQMVQSTLITVLALFLIRLYSLGPERPIPGWLITMVKIISCKCCKNRTSVDPAIHDGEEKVPNKKDSLIVSKINLANRNTGDSRENLQEDKYDWKRVVTTLDWFFMVIFSVFAFFSTFFCLLLAYVLSKATWWTRMFPRTKCSFTLMARTPLEPWKYVLDRGSSS